MPTHVSRFGSALILSVVRVGLIAGLLGGCGGATLDRPASAADLGLGPWEGDERDLFADEIDPSALGLIPPKEPRKDRVLAARAQAAELVGHAKIRTVTYDSRGLGKYLLTLQFAEPLLGPTTLKERSFEITVGPSSLSYGIVKTNDTGMQGKTFVGFVKRFANAEDEVEIHFFLTSDHGEVAKAVVDAIAIKEVVVR